MAKYEARPNQKEYSEGVKRLHKLDFRALHCRACPLGKTGFDRRDNLIPLEAHHTTLPYSIDKNQNPETGTLICSKVHKEQIHQGTGLSRKGLELMNEFRKNPRIARYDIRGLYCPYKEDDKNK